MVESFLYICIRSTLWRTVPPSDGNGHSMNEIKGKFTYYSSDDDIQRPHARCITCVSGLSEWCVMRSKRVVCTDKFDS